MSFPQLPTNFSPNLSDLLYNHKREIFLDLNCHALAIIDSFDPLTCTCKAHLAYCRTYFQVDENGVTTQKNIDYPPLFDLPVFIFGGGDGFISFPIQPGDFCQIHFNDRDIDNFLVGARSGPVNSTRLHAFSDGIALVGFKKPSSYDSNRVMVQNGTTYVGVGASKIKIANAANSLGPILENLVTDINNFSNTIQTTPVATDPATTLALANAIRTAATTLNSAMVTTHQILTKIQGLLE